MAFRYDSVQLRSPVQLPDGRIRVDGILTRSGVFTYRNPDGSERREYRPPDEVFHADSLASFALAPVTDDHPSEMVTASNARGLAVGVVGETVRQDGDFVIGSLMIFDQTTIEKMYSGKCALSCGYEVKIDHTPGVTPEGERFDAIQRKIKGNHVAIVDVGRAGPEARARMDSAIQVSHNTNPKPPTGEYPMEELKKALADLAKAEARADEAEAKLKTETERADKESARADAAEAAKADADKAREDAVSARPEEIKSRVALEMQASPILREDDTDPDLGALSDIEIKKSVIRKLDSKADLEGKSDAYIEARYDLALERETQSTRSREDLREVVAHNARSDRGNKSESARRDFLNRQQNSWQPKAEA